MNTKGTTDNTNISDKMQAFLTYVEGKSSNDEFVKKLEKEVSEIKQNNRWRRDYMNLVVQKQISLREGFQIGMERGEEIGMERGEEIGMKRGMAQGVAKGIIGTMRDMDATSEQIVEQIMKQMGVTEEVAKEYMEG